MLEPILLVMGVTLLGMLSPGPDMLIVMRNTLTGQRRAGIRTSLGVLTGNAVHMTYCLLGVGWLISQSILAFNVVKYVGALYLIYLGIQSLRAKHSPLDEDIAGTTDADQRWFLHGFASNLLNPKGTLFYLGVFTTLITPDMSWGMRGTLILAMTMVSASFWAIFVATLDRPAVRESIRRSRKIVDRIFGALLIALGLRVAALDR